MSEDERLSEELRAQVAALHASQLEAAEPLPLAARLRVSARLQQEALRQRRQRRVSWLAVGGLAAAAAVLLAVRREGAPQPTAAVSGPACALPAVASQSFEALPDGRRRIVLGGFGEIIASAAAEVGVEQSSACELALRLQSGELAGDLHSLRPSHLTIRTGVGDVVVTGTRFFVSVGSAGSARADDSASSRREDHGPASAPRGGAAVQVADALEIVLQSGVVDVVFADRDAVRLQPNTRLQRASTSQRPSTAPLSREDERALDALLLPLPAPQPTAARPTAAAEPEQAPQPTAAAPRVRPAAHERSLLESAEAERRAQHFAEARSLYRAAVQQRDESAEVALLRWVRLELEVSDAPAAARVLALHARRFARGRLGAEAGWLEVQIGQALQQPERARRAAERLAARFPGTPQADAAARVLGTP